MKIIDTFTFFNELTLLDLRLNILNDFVDKFVLVEARYSHQNKPKPLYYQDNKHLFEKFNHKIEHIIVETFPEHSYFSHEAYQRNYIINGVLDKCNPEDIVFISDLDEIWNPKKVIPFLKEAAYDTIYWWPSLICYFYFNLAAQKNLWLQPFYIRYGFLNELHKKGYLITEDLLRNTLNRFTVKKEFLEGLCGWHFSYTENPTYKLQNFLHSEYKDLTQNFLDDCIKQMINPFHKNQMFKIKDEELLGYLPPYVVQNIDKYQKYILK